MSDVSAWRIGGPPPMAGRAAAVSVELYAKHIMTSSIISEFCQLFLECVRSFVCVERVEGGTIHIVAKDRPADSNLSLSLLPHLTLLVPCSFGAHLDSSLRLPCMLFLLGCTRLRCRSFPRLFLHFTSALRVPLFRELAPGFPRALPCHRFDCTELPRLSCICGSVSFHQRSWVRPRNTCPSSGVYRRLGRSSPLFNTVTCSTCRAF